MRVIGHRGAAGLALENTLESIKAAIRAGVDAIELDIRMTQDGNIVLSHDRNTGRVSRKSSKIKQNSLAKLKKIRLNNGEAIITLSEAIKAAGTTPLVIEAKESDWAKPLTEFLQSHKSLPPCSVISFNHQELYSFHLLMPSVPVYAAERTKALEAIHTARLLKFTGVDLNFWLLNPLTYWLARFYKLDVLVFTVDWSWLARFLRLLYPRISITTNLPNQFQFLRKKRHHYTGRRKTN